jgi:acyl-homoserine-lactone acylase
VVTPRGLANPARALWALEQASRKLQLQYGKLDVPYGQVARLRRGSHDYPASAGPVQYGVYSAAELGPARAGKAEVWGGDTFIAVVELSQPPRAQGLLTYGNASQPGSRFVGDQLALFSRRELRPLWIARSDVEQHLDHTQRLPSSSTPDSN